MSAAARGFARAAGALGSGLLFGAGLVLGGMTNPRKIVGFLDVFGAWDASLLWVIGGAIGVHFLAYRWIRGWRAPLAADCFATPARRSIDARLVFGSAAFGVGWALGGYCPGPGIVSLASGRVGVLVFVVAWLCGSFATGKLEARRSLERTAEAEPSMADGAAV